MVVFPEVTFQSLLYLHKAKLAEGAHEILVFYKNQPSFQRVRLLSLLSALPRRHLQRASLRLHLLKASLLLVFDKHLFLLAFSFVSEC